MEILVKITWDKPQEQAWLCAHNIQIALEAYCINTKFNVEELKVVSKMDEVISCGNTLYAEINGKNKDVPSFFYEKLEGLFDTWIKEKSSLSFYLYCKNKII